MEQSLDTIFSDWDVTDQSDTIKITAEDCSTNDIFEICEQITSLREFIEGRSATFFVTDPFDVIHYKIVWENDGSVICRPETDPGTDSDDFLVDEDSKEALQSFRANNITSSEELRQALNAFANLDDSLVELEFRIPKSHISRTIEGELGDQFDVKYNRRAESFIDEIEGLSFNDAKEYFYPEGKKRVFVAQKSDGFFFGPAIALFSISNLEESEFNEFESKPVTLEDQIESVRTECAIDQFEDLYFPPGLLQITSQSDDFGDEFKDQIEPFQLLSCILGISNIARKQDEAWNVRISGRRVIEATLSLDKQNGEVYLHSESDSKSHDLEIESDTVNDFVNLFEWVYSIRTTDRITVLRNITTLYTTSIKGLLVDVDEIAESTKSNFKYYVKDSVNEFVDVQQDISNYVFETQREISDLRRNLANSLSQDLFRVAGLTIIAWAGILMKLQSFTTVRWALTVSMAPVILYLGLGLRSSYSLSQQYQSLEDTKQDYFSMYENQIDDRTLDKIRESAASESITAQFKLDLWIYYILFGALLLLGVYVTLDLALFHGPISDVVMDLVSQPS